MADAIAPESIPNPDLLFCRVHYTQFNAQENRIMRTVFSKPNQSVDWEKYSTREKTILRTGDRASEFRGVACIKVEVCRNQGQEVVHVPVGPDDPLGRNDAHSEIRGQKSKLVASMLRDNISEFWANPLYAPSHSPSV